MSNENRQTLLSIGALFLVLVAVIALYATAVIDWTLIIPLVLILSGLYLLVLGAMRIMKPVTYERSGFSTAAFGLILVAVGGAIYLFSINGLYSLILILIVFAALAIAAALKRK